MKKIVVFIAIIFMLSIVLMACSPGNTVTVADASLDNGHLILILSDGSSKDIGLIASVEKNGSDGEDGRGIVSSEVDSNGDLIITYTDGTIENAGHVVGEDGEDGTDGRNGKNGTNGTNGTNGINGANGSNGKDGTNGVDGTDGTDGKDGQNGTDGKDGKGYLTSSGGNKWFDSDEIIDWELIANNVVSIMPKSYYLSTTIYNNSNNAITNLSITYPDGTKHIINGGELAANTSTKYQVSEQIFTPEMAGSYVLFKLNYTCDGKDYVLEAKPYLSEIVSPEPAPAPEPDPSPEPTPEIL